MCSLPLSEEFGVGLSIIYLLAYLFFIYLLAFLVFFFVFVFCFIFNLMSVHKLYQ